MASSEGQLRCSFHASSDEKATSVLWFKPNQGKRSSFLLDVSGCNGGDDGVSPVYHVIPASPCNCYVECVMSENKDDDYFFLGGFQLISNARSVEVYVTKKGGKQEDLLMTCRGIPVRDNTTNLNDCFKIFSVVPGGPKPVSQLRLHLVAGGAGDDTNETKLVSIHLTGRIPNPHQQQQQTPNSQITPSSAMMLQQMIAASAPYNVNAYSATTPVASGSSVRNPFFSPPPPSSERLAGRPPSMMSPLQSQTPSSTSGRKGAPILYTSASTPTDRNKTNSEEAILAGVTFLVRSEGEATVQLLQSEIQKSQNAVLHRLQAMEQRIQQQQAMMETMIQQQQVMVQKQFEMMILLQRQQLQLQQQQEHAQWRTQHESELEPSSGGINDEHFITVSYTDAIAPSTTNHTSDSPELRFPTESIYDPSCRIKLSSMPASIVSNAASVARQSEVMPSELANQGSANFEDCNFSEGKQRNSQADLTQGDGTDHRAENIPQEKNGFKNELEIAESEDDTDEKERSSDDTEEKENDFDGGKEDDDPNDFASGLGEGPCGNPESHEPGEQNHPSNSSNQNNEQHGEGQNSEMKYNKGTHPEPSLQQNELHEKGYNFNCAYTLQKKLDDAAIMKAQFLFLTEKKGIFPAKLDRPHKEPKVPGYLDDCVANDGALGSYEGGCVESSCYTPTIEKTRSMVSIQYCNTVATGLPSLSSEGMTYRSINQAESIEVLAVFPASPSTGATPTSLADSRDIDANNSSSFSSEGEYDGISYEDDDLVSVALVGDENEVPQHPRKPLYGSGDLKSLTRVQVEPN